MNYGALTLFPYELPTMTLDPIKLPSDNTFSHFVSQMDSQWRDNFFFSIFAPTLEGISVILVI
jgi:hypothetical protein